MKDLFEAFETASVDNKNQTIVDLFECQKAYAQLIREYKEEFEYVQNSLKGLREERRNFYKLELPKIKEVLETDIVQPEAQKIWVEELQKDMERSFLMSERLLNDLAVKQMDEFKQEAERIIKEGK